MAKPKGNSEPEESAMGFKDQQKALDTLKVLDGRDISYQFHVITSFVSRAKRTIQITKDEEKLANIREAQQVFEDWLTDYKENHRSKENFGYLPIETVKGFRALAKKYGVLDDSFYRAYKNEKGDYKALRGVKTLDGSRTWDIERNVQLKEIIAKIKSGHIQWFETDVGEFRGFPTKEHAECIQLGYSPEPTKIKKLIAQVEEKFEEASEDEEMEILEDEDKESSGKAGAKKRPLEEKNVCSRLGSSSSDSEEEDDEPKRKMPRKEKNSDQVEKTENKKNEEKEESGLSFKDKDRAVNSLKSLEGRDVAYQYHAIAGLIKRAERVISCTKDEEKIKNMKEAVEVYENWITDYNVNGRSKENFGYLALDLVQAYKPLADRYEVEDTGFLKAYEQEEGDYKRLRSVKVPDSKTTWDIERNNNLRSIVGQIKSKHIQWFETDVETNLRGLPTLEHTRCIMWGFSHDAAKLKKLIPTLKEKLASPESN